MISYHTAEFVCYKAKIEHANEREQLEKLNDAIMSDKNITERERWELYRLVLYGLLDIEAKGDAK